MSQQINLFNPALLKQKQVFTTDTMLSSLGLLLAGALALGMYAQQSVKRLESEAASVAEQLNQKKMRQATVMTEFAPRRKTKELEVQLEEAQAMLRALHDIETTLQRGELGDTRGYAEYFKALARQSAGELWLTGVSIGAAGKHIGLQGRALEARLVPAYIGRLTREPVMQGKTFGSLSIGPGASADKAARPGTEAPYIEFSLQAENGAKAAEAGK